MIKSNHLTGLYVFSLLNIGGYRAVLQYETLYKRQKRSKLCLSRDAHLGDGGPSDVLRFSDWHDHL